MDITQAAALAEELMQRYGMQGRGWYLKFDSSKRRFGRCNYRAKCIQMSGALAELNPEVEVRDTILHEIAHALVGPGHHHGRTWKLKAVEVGARPEACYGASIVQPAANWIGRCIACSKEFHRFRLPMSTRTAVHSPCRRAGRDGRLEWRKNDAK